ncbi:hypothetical protein SB00610_01886 [Klebsiella quasipneumoniae subsp. similipneumoniae]|nr:hypothetical protein SB00610_01886 [Klebsiella quasipneumoniae subsp. similipneumoniae]
MQKAQDNFLAIAAGQSGDAKGELPSGEVQRELTILRQTMLGDIETGHHFESCDNRRGQLGRQQRQGV